MADAVHDFAPPRIALIGAGLLLAATFGAALLGRAEIGSARMPDLPVVESRLLTIESSPDFSAIVKDATDGSLIRVAKAGEEEGFVWGAVNGLSYGRKRAGGPADAPYELARLSDGRLTLTDLITGEKVFLDSFGQGNARAFARLLEHKEAAR